MPANDMFHEKTIGRLTFRAYVGRSPYIEATIGRDRVGDTPLGHCTLIAFVEKPDRGAPGWFLCKYSDDEPRIRLAGLSPEEIADVACEFGIPIYPHTFFKFAEFTDSPCFASLLEWTGKHPRLTASLLRNRLDYLPGLQNAIDAASAGPAPKM